MKHDATELAAPTPETLANAAMASDSENP